MPYNVLIVGVGLIGGSLGLSLRESPLINKIIGFDTDELSLAKALEIGAIDGRAELYEGVRMANIIILCTPLSSFLPILLYIKPYLRPGTIITDVGSTKQYVMNMFSELLPDTVWGIGGHPMAGSEIKGIPGADRYLFENAVYVLTPTPSTPEEITNKLADLLASTGARMKVMTASHHDEVVATVSHIPHIAAVSLVNLTGGNDDQLMMAAGGFRDTTRIASSDSKIWEDILFSNRSQVLGKLGELINNLQNFHNMLASEDREVVSQHLESAKQIRDKIPAIRKGLLPVFCDIICIVPDSPGIIGEIGSLLGEYAINIVDIEILRAREGDGGTMRLGVPSLEAAHQAVKVLQARNIKAWVR